LLTTNDRSKRLTTRFSTDEVPIADSAAILHDVFGRVYLRAQIDSLGDLPMRAQFELHSWPSASLLIGNACAPSYTRTRDLVADGDDSFRFICPEAAAMLDSEGTIDGVSAGEAMLLFNGAVGKACYKAGGITAIRIGHQKLAAAVPRLERRAFLRVRRDSPALRLLLQYVTLLRQEGPSTDVALNHHVSQHIVDLVALAICPTEETRERLRGEALRAARLATIRADVLANLGHARLSAKTVARRHGVSDRHVHVLFETTGQTFSRFVEEERLKYALALLTDPKLATISVGEVAARAGYTDHSTFTRAFRRQFGAAPKDVRRKTAAEGACGEH
jgi:AraC-like DNA-binding protein